MSRVASQELETTLPTYVLFYVSTTNEPLRIVESLRYRILYLMLFKTLHRIWLWFVWYCVRRDDWKDCWARFLLDALHCDLHPTGMSIGQSANVNVRQRNRFFISLTKANIKFNVTWFLVRGRNSTIWRVKWRKKCIKLRHDLCKKGFKRKIVSTFVRNCAFVAIRAVLIGFSQSRAWTLRSNAIIRAARFLYELAATTRFNKLIYLRTLDFIYVLLWKHRSNWNCASTVHTSSTILHVVSRQCDWAACVYASETQFFCEPLISSSIRFKRCPYRWKCTWMFRVYSLFIGFNPHPKERMIG